jgi:hypothetical protein
VDNTSNVFEYTNGDRNGCTAVDALFCAERGSSVFAIEWEATSLFGTTTMDGSLLAGDIFHDGRSPTHGSSQPAYQRPSFSSIITGIMPF